MCLHLYPPVSEINPLTHTHTHTHTHIYIYIYILHTVSLVISPIVLKENLRESWKDRVRKKKKKNAGINTN